MWLSTVTSGARNGRLQRGEQRREERIATPIEFGATNLISSDPIKHSNKGAIGSLIIEAQGATWIEDADSRAQATVTKIDGTSFREFVVQFQTTST